MAACAFKEKESAGICRKNILIRERLEYKEFEVT